jgi:hypothetical protein
MERKKDLHPAERCPRDLHTRHSGVNDMPKHVIVSQTMRKHAVEGVAVGQGILALAMIG